MQVRARRGELGQAALDRRVYVLVRVPELERAAVELALDLTKTALDCGESRFRQQACPCQRAGMGAAAGDVDRVELEVGFQRRREVLQLGEQAALEAAAP